MLTKDYTLGVDIGSTTVKVALLDANKNLIFSDYKRHFANIRETMQDLVQEAYDQVKDVRVHPVITGSGGLALAGALDIPFTQEVIAVATSLKKLAPKTDVAIELGGEDAKIIYFEGGNVEQRMNGICAGGTGSFIDQMASLLQTDAAGLNEYAKHYQSLYNIAALNQRGCNQRGSGRLHLSGGGQSDDFRSCLRQTDPRTCRLFRRASSFPFGTEGGFYPHLETGCGAYH